MTDVAEDLRRLRVKCGACDHELEGWLDVSRAQRTGTGLSLLSCVQCGKKTAFPMARPYDMNPTDADFLRAMRIDPEVAA